MKINQKYQKTLQMKTQNTQKNPNLNKKTTDITENHLTLLNYFEVSSLDKIPSTNLPPSKGRQDKKKDKTDAKKDITITKFLKNKLAKDNEKKTSTKKLLKKRTNNNINKIDTSKFILFSENFSKQIKNIFENNFQRNFKHYLDKDFIEERKNIGPRHELNISNNSFNKFLKHIFHNYITKYLLNTYRNLIYVSKKYITDTKEKKNNSEIGLLSYIEKPDILLEYLPINLNESKLFYPDLSSMIIKFIKNFRKTKRYKKPNCALLLYRPNNDFITYINKIRLICDQMGYNLLVREDEANKLMTFEKLKLINQNYVIGSLRDKNKKYLQIIDSISTTDKWNKFLKAENIYETIEVEEKMFYNKNNRTQLFTNTRKKKINKTQSTINTTQALSKKILQNKKNKIKNDDKLSNTILTFIGHDTDNELNSQDSENIDNSKEYLIAQNYQQNVLENFNKRKNLILFVDNFEDNEENKKYINQINTLIPNSKSPIIILTNNLPSFTDNLILGSTSFQTRYIPCQIKNEGITKKENIIYMTFLILYFTTFFPNPEFKKKIILDNKVNEDKDNNNKDNEDNKANEDKDNKDNNNNANEDKDNKDNNNKDNNKDNNNKDNENNKANEDKDKNDNNNKDNNNKDNEDKDNNNNKDNEDNKANEDKDNNNNKDNEDNKDNSSKNNTFSNLNNNDKNDKNDEYKNYYDNLDKIEKAINNVFIDTDLNAYKKIKLFSSIISLSYIIAIINNYELDNILVYLKNLFLFIDIQLKYTPVILNTSYVILYLKNKVLEDLEEYQIKDDIAINDDITKLNDIYEENSFNDYEYGKVYNTAEKIYEQKIKNYGINKGVDYNKDSYFYTNKFCDNKKEKKIFNYISNKEINQRIIEDYKFYRYYYNSSENSLNHNDIAKINLILNQIIFNERILPEHVAKFTGSRTRNNYPKSQKINFDENFKKNKIIILNKIFRKCPLELFNKYIDAHIGPKYYIEFNIEFSNYTKKYLIPEKLSFYNYYNDYYLMEQIRPEQEYNYFDDNEDKDDESDEEDDIESEEDSD